MQSILIRTVSFMHSVIKAMAQKQTIGIHQLRKGAGCEQF